MATRLKRVLWLAAVALCALGWAALAARFPWLRALDAQGPPHAALIEACGAHGVKALALDVNFVERRSGDYQVFKAAQEAKNPKRSPIIRAPY